MHRSRKSRTARHGNITVALGLLAAVAAMLAAESSARPQSPDPAALSARDAHQGLLIAVRPDADATSSKARFGPRSPYGAGNVGLEVYFRNDNDQPLEITLNTVQLFIGAPGEKQQRLDSISHDRVADLIFSVDTKDPTKHRAIPSVGLHPARDKNWLKLDEQLRLASAPPAVPPHATARGYFYFDIDRHFDWLSNARLEVPDVILALTHKPLLFFEIDLAPVAPASVPGSGANP